MRLIPTTKNAIALYCTTAITFGFFVAGLFKILDYFIVKAFLFLSFGILFILAFNYALKNESKKNRPEDTLQDDSH
ncbi:hypothetical protein FBALC1_11652 [Flavobacteriales bacterium ALC-1]|nr:hypothetical protein FBALC1_11652 [Flavobacteriales bacterium ALC-1]